MTTSKLDDSYEKSIQGLLQGPRLKSEASFDWETISRAFLDKSNTTECRYNALGELEVKINDKIYNLSLILQNKPDFEHITIPKDQITDYENFIKNEASLRPTFEGRNDIPSTENYEERDPTGKFKDLFYGEKLAITLYTWNSAYELINQFLRLDGKLDELKNLSPKELNLKVKEIILATSIASQGLSRISPDASLNSKDTEKFRRIETTVKILDDTRRNNMNKEVEGVKGAPTLFSGFSSVSVGDKASKFQKKEISETTIIEYQQPVAPSPMGKHITELSRFPEESEALFPPNTEFKYYFYDHESKENIHKFMAVPVRTIASVDPFSYSSKASSLRSEMLEIYSHLDIADKFSIYDLELLKLAIIEKLDKTKYDPKFLTKVADDLITEKQFLQKNKLFVDAVTDVYEKYLKHEFTETHLCAYDLSVKIQEVDIPRPNHGLAHTVRVASYVPAFIDYFKKFAIDDNFKEFCAKLSEKEIMQIQIALLFYVSGRKSEVARSDSEDGVKAVIRHKQESAKQFEKYVKENHELKAIYSEADIKKFSDILLRDQSYYDEMGSRQTDYQYCFNIMESAHTFDLMRCCGFDAYNNSINKINSKFVTNNPNPDQKKELNGLLNLVKESILATGDRLLTSFDQDKLVSINAINRTDKFITSSTNPEACVSLCAKTLIKHAPFTMKISSPSTDVKSDKNYKETLAKLLFQEVRNGHTEMTELLIFELNRSGIQFDINLEHENGFTLLDFAAKNNHANVIKILIENGADPNHLNQSGVSAAHLAADANQVKAILMLKELKADLNSKEANQSQSTSLHRAVSNNSLESIKALLTNNANPNSEMHEGYTPLHLAVSNSNVEIVKILLENGADLYHPNIFGINPLEQAAIEKNNGLIAVFARTPQRIIEMVNALDKIKNETNKQFLVQAIFDIAITTADESTLTTIINKGANVNKENELNFYPLQQAALSGKTNIVKLLLANGAQYENQIKDNPSPLHLAASVGHVDIVSLLLDHGDNPMQEDAAKNTSIDIAIQCGQSDVVKLFLSRGLIDIKEKNSKGMTPYELAIHHSRANVVKILPDEDINLLSNGITPLHIAINNNQPEIIKILLQKKANPNIRNANGVSAFQIAILNTMTPAFRNTNNFASNLALIRMLLDSGADPLLSNNGPCPLEITFLNNYKDIILVMMEGDHLIDLINRADNQQRQMLLYTAAEKGDLRAVKQLLLNQKTDPLQTTRQGDTPFEIAIAFGHSEIVEEMTNTISEPHLAINKSNPLLNNMSPFELAIACRKEEIIKILIDRGADLYQKNSVTQFTPLMSAIHTNNLNIVKSILSPMAKKEHINQPSSTGILPLQTASEMGNKEIVSFLISEGADVNQKCLYGSTILHWTARGGNAEVIALLIEKGVDVNAQDENGLTPLHYAVQANKPEAIKALLKNGANSDLTNKGNMTPLEFAINTNARDVITTLAFGSHRINVINNIVSTQGDDDLKEGLLYGAIEEEDEQSIIALLQKNTSVDKQDRNGKSSLHVAVEKGNLAIFQHLLKKSTQINLSLMELAIEKNRVDIVRALLNHATDYSTSSNYFLRLAIKRGFENIVIALLDHGADINEFSGGFPLISMAAQEGNNKILNVLLEKKVAVNQKNNDGISALMIAAANKKSDTILLLLQNGANVTDCDNEGRTALHYAAKYGDEIVTNILLANGAEFVLNQKQNKQLTTALHFAVEEGNIAIVKSLLASGADVDVLDKSHQSLFSYIPLNKKGAEITKLLFEHGADLIKLNALKHIAHHIIEENEYDLAIHTLLVIDSSEIPENLNTYLTQHIKALTDQFINMIRESSQEKREIYQEKFKTSVLQNIFNFPYVETASDNSLTLFSRSQIQKKNAIDVIFDEFKQLDSKNMTKRQS